MGAYYAVSSTIIENPSNDRFRLHVHSNYEIYMFLEGDTKYIVEEDVYSLEHGDVILIRKNLLHRAYHNSSVKYQSVVFDISPDFFEENNCKEYEEQFINSSLDIGNKIDAEVVRESGLYEAIMRVKKYSDNFTNYRTPIIRAMIIEVLYIINSITEFSKGDVNNKRIQSIIAHINRHFTENITLDHISKKFFISKYHLCHIFPEATGLTVHQYITNKRLAMADDLIKNGIAISEAAEKSGFNNYSSFYRSYVAAFKKPPSK